MKTQKYYPIEISPLYRISSLRRLAAVLNVEPKQLKQLEKDPIFAVFPQDKREIQEPKGLERRVHDRIQTLLSRIETPDYVFSGKRGICYVDNAQRHVNNTDLMAVDILGFYKNTKIEHVFRFFHYQLKIPCDLAHLLSKVCCYKDMIPTGSPLSQSLAYWSYKIMFDEIAQIALGNSLDFSVYVDDMAFSRNEPIPQTFHLEIDAILKTYGLRLKRKKIEYKGKTQYKRITGCIISPKHELLVPNRNRDKIRHLLTDLSQNTVALEITNYQVAMGSIASAQQIEPKLFSDMQRSLKAKWKARVKIES